VKIMRATRVQLGLAWGLDFWVVRVVLVVRGAVSYTLGPSSSWIAGCRGGFLMAVVVLLAELRLRRVGLSGLLGGAFGVVLGVFAALLVTLVIPARMNPNHQVLP